MQSTESKCVVLTGCLLCLRWYFAKGMTTEEAYVFVCYDSRDGRARFTPHTGFADPTAPADAPPRESVELRSYVFWEQEARQPYTTQL